MNDRPAPLHVILGGVPCEDDGPIRDEDAERWLPVVGFEGLYEISDLGRVRSLDRVTNGVRFHGREIRGSADKNGYRTCNLWRRGLHCPAKFHRLVLEAFVGPSSGRLALHRNDVPHDNRLANLYWGSAKQNTADSIALGGHKRGSAHKNSKLNESDIHRIRALRPEMTLKALAARFGVSPMTIHYITSGKQWRHVK